MIIQIIGIILLALGIWMTLTWDRSVDNKTLTIVILLGILFIFIGVKILFGSLSFELIERRIVGIIFGFVGVYFIIGFPDVVADYQSPGMTWFMTFLGIIFVVASAYLILV